MQVGFFILSVPLFLTGCTSGWARPVYLCAVLKWSRGAGCDSCGRTVVLVEQVGRGGAADLLHDNLNNRERAALAGVVTDTSFRILLADGRD